jgi:hypothetical protein
MFNSSGPSATIPRLFEVSSYHHIASIFSQPPHPPSSCQHKYITQHRPSIIQHNTCINNAAFCSLLRRLTLHSHHLARKTRIQIADGPPSAQLGWRYNEPKYTIHTQAHISKHNPATQHKSHLQTNQKPSNCQTNPDHKTTGAEALQTGQQTI